MFKRIFTVLFLFTGISSFIYGQTYQGPAQGSVPSGATVSTDNFSKVSSIVNPKERIGNEESEYFQDVGLLDFPTPKEGSNYYVDHNGRGTNVDDGFVLRDFAGIPDQGNIIPPDPYCAVGPEYFIATVNSRFRIYDKYGNVLKTIEAQQWFNNVFPSANVFDPKIIYDAFDQRWVIVWLEENDGTHTSTLLLSVSDDENPLGTWYNWALPANLNGTTNSNTWTDYHGLGYDQNAIYVTCNQFSFTGLYQFAKIRIIPKAQLYANTAGSVIWNDIWNIGLPPGPTGSPYHMRPAEMHTVSDTFYCIWSPYQGAGNFISLYKITNPLGTPALSGINVPTVLFFQTPNANQLGGGNPLIDAGQNSVNEPKYKDGYIYYVHAVRNPSSAGYSAFHYVKINTSTNTADQDYVYGDAGYWYLYPSIEVDKDNNIAVTFSRSGDSSYVGAYFTTRRADDPPGFNSSVPVKVGEANYVKTFGDTRNRWGDYNGIYLDPVDQNNFWLFTEYAAAPANTWGTWVGEFRAVPYTGPHFFVKTSALKFGSLEIDSVSNAKLLTLYNYGTDDIVITNIPDTFGPFDVVDNPGSATISPFDSLVLSIQFTPTEPGYYDEIFNVESNDPDFQGIQLTGTGYIINPVIANVMYASTGLQSNGKLLKVNLLTGAADSIGSSNHDDVDFISKISVNPKNNVLYGLVSGENSSILIRVNALAGDAYTLFTLNVDHLVDAVFDTSGTLYTIQSNGKIYSVSLTNGNTTFISNAGININAIAFDPTNNDLYGTALIQYGSNKDRIYKLNLLNGGYTVIGNTGFHVMNNDIEFDAEGNMYGIIGNPTDESKLISIDKSTGVGTEIGLMGYNEVTGLAYARTGVTGVKQPDNSKLPVSYALEQNFPNPFNPSTKIEYSLPVSSNITITIYNLLGEVVNTLVNGQQNAGFHSISWNSNDNHGTKVGSGVYFYELKADGINGAQFTRIRKMVLLK